MVSPLPDVPILNVKIEHQNLTLGVKMAQIYIIYFKIGNNNVKS